MLPPGTLDKFPAWLVVDTGVFSGWKILYCPKPPLQNWYGPFATRTRAEEQLEDLQGKPSLAKLLSV